MSDWRPLAIAFDHVGSRVTCNPPPTDTDDDWLCLDTFSGDVEAFLVEAGYTVCGNPDQYGEDEFVAYRKGDENVIIVNTEYAYNSFMLATRLAKRFNLLIKDDRKALFQAIMNGDDYYANQEVTNDN